MEAVDPQVRLGRQEKEEGTRKAKSLIPTQSPPAFDGAGRQNPPSETTNA